MRLDDLGLEVFLSYLYFLNLVDLCVQDPILFGRLHLSGDFNRLWLSLVDIDDFCLFLDRPLLLHELDFFLRFAHDS